VLPSCWRHGREHLPVLFGDAHSPSIGSRTLNTCSLSWRLWDSAPEVVADAPRLYSRYNIPVTEANSREAPPAFHPPPTNRPPRHHRCRDTGSSASSAPLCAFASRAKKAQQTVGQRPLIASFWHACIIPATYMCRNLGVRVMSSNSYDGEYMGRIIRQIRIRCRERFQQPQRRARPARPAPRSARRAGPSPSASTARAARVTK
jgi:hypothetical protein